MKKIVVYIHDTKTTIERRMSLTTEQGEELVDLLMTLADSAGLNMDEFHAAYVEETGREAYIVGSHLKKDEEGGDGQETD
ncbi:MAG: hypothetical protein DWQ07_13990 [Chloroflexi bacterium]|nr:MAG: hypothetical protein DWQ07_13990 [Chloroflexota bacterium]